MKDTYEIHGAYSPGSGLYAKDARVDPCCVGLGK